MSAENSASTTRLLADLSGLLQRAAVTVVWTQWGAVGAAVAGRREARSIVDPEALVLASLNLAGDERRLRDIVSDWTTVNSSLLSVQRIKNLTASGPPLMRERLRAFAQRLLESGRDFRWRVLAAEASRSAREWEPRTNRARAVEARDFGEAGLWLRLRLGLGVGTKADTLAFLLGTSTWGNTRAIAVATGYTPAAIGRALDDLVAAGLVLANEGGRGRSQYRVPTDAWARIFDIESPMPVWRYWQDRFALVEDCRAWADAAKERVVSRYAFGVKGRELLEKHQRAFEREQWDALSTSVAKPDAAEHVETALRDLAREMLSDV